MFAPAVVTVHDLAYHTVPKSFSLPSRLFLRWATKDAVRRARAVIVPSHATETDLRRFHPECADRVHVVPHGVDPVVVVPDATLAETRALKTDLAENLAMVSDTVRFLTGEGRRVFVDCEHFFDGYRANPAYALEVVKTSADAGAEVVVLAVAIGLLIGLILAALLLPLAKAEADARQPGKLREKDEFMRDD